MPDGQADRALHLVADLHFTVSGARGEAVGHLHGASEDLILDVDEPAVLLAQTRRRLWPDGETLRTAGQLVPDLPVLVRSNGRELGRVRVSDGGKLSVRPTPAGVLTAARIGLSDNRVRLGLSVVAAAVAVAVTRWRR